MQKKKQIRPKPPWPTVVILIVGAVFVGIFSIERVCFYFIKMLGIHDINKNLMPYHQTQLELPLDELPVIPYRPTETTPMEVNGYTLQLPYAFSAAVSTGNRTILSKDERPKVDITNPIALPNLRIQWGCLSGPKPLNTTVLLLQAWFLGVNSWSELLQKVYSTHPEHLQKAKTCYQALSSYLCLKLKTSIVYSDKRYYKALDQGCVTVDEITGGGQSIYVLSLITTRDETEYGTILYVSEANTRETALAEAAYIADHIRPTKPSKQHK